MNEHSLSYEEIRPYHPEEVPEVMLRLSQKPSFFMLMSYLFPGEPGEEVAAKFRAVASVEQFQTEFIRHAIWRILQDSAEEVTWEGFEQLRPDRRYLFLSNHRDIILDSAILNVLLHRMDLRTTKIAIGDNLMVSGLVTDLMKLNKSFVVHREVARQDMLPYSQRLSRYIREQICSGIDSVWMAQRSGRTKDGNDQTYTGLLKMLHLSGQADPLSDFLALNLTPMAVSYEFDPCDGLKAEERYHVQRGLSYTKDDKEAMIKGIREPKGRIHLAIGAAIAEWAEHLPVPRNLNAWLRELADLIDREIHLKFRLWPNNFLAADLLEDGNRHASQYTSADQARFEAHVTKQLSDKRGEPEALRTHLLEIYATPVWNQEQAI